MIQQGNQRGTKSKANNLVPWLLRYNGK